MTSRRDDPPDEQPYDDEHCSCGAELPANPTPNSWSFHGFCHQGCAVRDPGAFDLMGIPALQLAETPGRYGGPGFERFHVRAWLDAARPEAPAMLTRYHGSDINPKAPSDSWLWRLMSGGVCHAERYTPKDNMERRTL